MSLCIVDNHVSELNFHNDFPTRVPVKILRSHEKSFAVAFDTLVRRTTHNSRPDLEKKVAGILASVKKHGDRALKKCIRDFEHHKIDSLRVSPADIRNAYTAVSRDALNTLRLAAGRIRSFHQEQGKQNAGSWVRKKDGIRVGESVTPLQSTGIYVPGGLAAYPSTVLMNAIPAQVAGVPRIAMASPWMGGKSNPFTLVAADLLGITEIYKMGGAQAIAALAYGTKTIPAVDKIVGPGNVFVATAKRLVYGTVAIDSMAGPTEILILADESANPVFLASDFLSQAEHDPMALPLLITTHPPLIAPFLKELRKQKTTLQRGDILEQALRKNGVIIVAKDREESILLANALGAEHLEIHMKRPRTVASKIHNAGAVFIGPYSPVAIGDYLAGPNHVLPTENTSRFSSPLGVSDFLKRSSIIEFSKNALQKLGTDVIRLSTMEGLPGHGASVRKRLGMTDDT